MTREERKALLSVRDAAETLWQAHRKTHNERGWPARYGMNYGELNQLREALDRYNICVKPVHNTH